MKTTKYITYVEMPAYRKIKTKIFEVVSTSNRETLGTIKWYGPWRQYVFFPESETIWNTTCLQDINNFISELMKDRTTK